jgi:hypothetical protein
MLFEIPGKIFLMGEYSVIEGGRAIVAPVRPPFRYEYGTQESHPESPYGRYVSEFGPLSNQTIRISSEGPGAGFGSSTAELIAGAFAHRGRDLDLQDLLSWYQSRFPDTSGADLLIQGLSLNSRTCLYSFVKRGEASLLVPDPATLNRVLVFRAPSVQKIPTHEDLRKSRPKLDLLKLNDFTNHFSLSLQGHSEEGLKTLNCFAEYLSFLGLETPFAAEVRKSFLGCSGVLAAKGCGAGLNDVFIVVVEAAFSKLKHEALLDKAREYDLLAMGDLGELLW